MSELRIGSLCSGYEGLGLAVTEVLGGDLAWVADNDPGACKILAHRFPGVPNLGDIGETDWATVEPVDILTAGFPCQDVSCAGARAGLREGNRTGVWAHVARAIDVLRPSLVVLENVRGLLSAKADSNVEWCPWCLGEADPELALRALGAVLGDLADLGFDAEGTVVSASDVGAPHKRERVFVIAWPAADAESAARWRDGGTGPELRQERLSPEPDDGRVGTAADAADGVRRALAGSVAGSEEPGRDEAPGGRVRAGHWGTGDDGSPAGDGAAEDPDRATGGEWRQPAPGQAPGRRPRADAGRPGGAHADCPDFQSRAAGVGSSAGLEVGAVTDNGPERQAAERGSGNAPADSDDNQPDEPESADRAADERAAARRRVVRTGGRASPDAERDRQPGWTASGTGEADEPGEGSRPEAEGRGPGTAADAEHGSEPQRPRDTRRESGKRSPVRGGSECDSNTLADPERRGRDGLHEWQQQGHLAANPGRSGEGIRSGAAPGQTDWGPYEPAIRRWESVLGRSAPSPTEPGRTGERLSPRFVEWMMGLPEGWVTDVPGLSRNQQLHALGNGVVPQQAAFALRLLLAEVSEAAA